jgi:hypothetical protein
LVAPSLCVAIVGIGIGVARSDGTIALSAALVSLVLAVAGLERRRRELKASREVTNAAAEVSRRGRRVSPVNAMMLFGISIALIVSALWLFGAL